MFGQQNQVSRRNEVQISEKSWLVTLVLLLIAPWGFYAFYLGNIKKGLIWLWLLQKRLYKKPSYLCILLLIPLLFLWLCWLVKAPAIVTILTILIYAGPCGMNPVIYATEHGVDNRKVAGLLLVSMPLATVTIPLIYALAIWVTGG